MRRRYESDTDFLEDDHLDGLVNTCDKVDDSNSEMKVHDMKDFYQHSNTKPMDIETKRFVVKSCNSIWFRPFLHRKVRGRKS